MTTSIKSTVKKIDSSRAFKVAASINFFLALPLILIAIAVYYNEDFGYDTVRDICRIATALSSVLSSVVGLKIACGRNGGKSALNIAKGLGLAAGGPIAVYLVGLLIIDNYGGLGAE